MLVAIAGSQGSGKSTLLANLKDDNTHQVTRKTSRSILSDWGVSLAEVNSDCQLTIKFQDEILKRKLNDDRATHRDATNQSSWTNPIVYTERTPIDLLVYATVALGSDNDYDQWLTSYARTCIEATVQYYSHVFYLMGGLFTVQSDGVRGHNKYYSQMVDAAMLSFYKTHVPYEQLTIIATADIDTRVNLIRDKIAFISA